MFGNNKKLEKRDPKEVKLSDRKLVEENNQKKTKDIEVKKKESSKKKEGK